MNERFVKLFMQSVDSNYIPLPIEDHIPSWTEKFAEFIVRECADISDASFHDGSAGYTAILKYFGVKE